MVLGGIVLSNKIRKRTVKEPDIIYRDKKPVSVIIDIDEYNKLLEQIEDIDDLKFIKGQKNKKLSFRKLNDILADNNNNV